MDGAPGDAAAWLAARPGGVSQLLWWRTPDGAARLASAGTDGTVRVRDPDTGAAVGSPLPIRRAVTVLALAGWAVPAGGYRLACAGEDAAIYLWDAETGAAAGAPLTGHTGWVAALAAWRRADGGVRLASAARDGTIRRWAPDAGTPVGAPLTGHDGPVWALASWAGADGPRLVSGGEDGTIRQWDAETGAPIGPPLTGHSSAVWALAAWTGSTGPRLASASNDGTVRVWDLDTGQPVGAPLTGYRGWLPALANWTAPDGTARLASAGDDGSIHIWAAESGAPAREPLRGTAGWAPVLTAGPGRDGRIRLAASCPDGSIRIWDPETGAPVGDALTGHTAGVWALASWTGPAGDRLASAGDDGTIRIWNADTGAAAGAPLTGHAAAIWRLVTWVDAAGHRRLASTGDDGTVRVWDPDTGTAVGRPLTGHQGWVPGLTTVARAAGQVMLVSAGLDGTVRRWDPDAGCAIGAPLTGHSGWVMAVAGWTGPDGRQRLASGSTDGTILRWDAETGAPVGAPLAGHAGWIRSLATWTTADGSARLASASYDETVRIWDPDTGAAVGAPLPVPDGGAAVAAWAEADSATRLATAGTDGVIVVWDADAGTPVGPPLTGHAGWVMALATWRAAEGTVRLASGAYDGTVRLWDPRRGVAIRTIEVGPIGMWALSDVPAATDVLGRQPLADAVAEQLRGGGAGPMVVSVEGPWGCGKTTLMELIRRRLTAASTAPAPPPEWGPLTVRAALGQLRRHDGPPAPRPDRPEPGTRRGVVTAWFNPWAHQSGEQVWAGLANEIIEAARPVLYPTRGARERYWFARNLRRLDRYALRRALHRRIVSPLLAVALVAVAAPLAVVVAEMNRPFRVAGLTITAAAVALGVPVALLLAGLVHTGGRYRYGRASHYLPAELFEHPIADGLVADGLGTGWPGGPADPITDPLRRARAGSLYLHQHDIGELLGDLGAAGYDLVVFIDDIDRCRAGTTAEVFEAVNLFLSSITAGTGLHARFVIGLDPAVVAAHLDRGHADLRDAGAALYGDDPTPGWAFLRKLIQLPVVVPQIPDGGIDRFVGQATRAAGDRRPDPPASGASPAAGRTQTPTGVPDPPAAVRRPDPPSPPPPPRPVETVPWRSIEQHPAVQALLVQRLADQPDRSVREAKRLLNVWQLYERVLAGVDPLNEPAAAIRRAQHLVLVAEIVTRWPALQRALHRPCGARRGLQLLAAAAADDAGWRRAVEELAIDPTEQGPALAHLRGLLRGHDGPAVAALASRLL